MYPALAGVPSELFGICVAGTSGSVYTVGDADVEFTLMSVSKPFVFALVCEALGPERARDTLGRERNRLPFNLADCDRDGAPTAARTRWSTRARSPQRAWCRARSADAKWRLIRDGLSSLRRPTSVARRRGVRRPASATNQRNQDIARLLQSYGRIACDPAERHRSLHEAVLPERERARPGGDGRNARRRRRQSRHAASAVVDPETCRYALAVMTTAGLYETSGDWLYDVGLPGKSGISGGVITVSPGKGGLGTFAPPLDDAGNSIKGQLAARFLSRRLGLDLFASRARAVARHGDGRGTIAGVPARSRRLLYVLVAALALVAVPCAAADLADETALAERYAPVVRLVAQAQDCGYGESYEPINVDVLFDEQTVALRGPWGPGDLIKVGPSAKDLSSNLYEYHLDFPGSALDPGCDYERWADRITEGKAPAVYAHVATDADHPGKLALQYWFYYVFNDWNNTARRRLGEHPAHLRRRRRARRRSQRAGVRRLQPARGLGEGDVGRRQARARRRDASGRVPGGRVARELLRIARSSSAARPNRASAATTRLARASTSSPVVRTIPSDPAKRARCFRGSGSRDAGVSFSGRSSTVRRARISRRRGRSRSACRRTGGIEATRFQQAAPSGRRRLISSAPRSARARPRCGGRSTTRFPFCWPSGRSSRSFWSGSPARRGGRPHRSVWHAAARGAKSSPRRRGCTPDT